MSTIKACFRHNIDQLPQPDQLELIANDDRCFGEYVAASRTLNSWKAHRQTRTTLLDVKTKSHSAAIKLFRDLFSPAAYFVQWHEGSDWRDDRIVVFFRK